MIKRNNPSIGPDIGLRSGLGVGLSVGQHFARYVRRVVGGLFLAAAIVAPFVFVADANGQAVQVRIYDSNHRDYHNWDDHEDRAYRRYVAERRWEYREYNHQSHRRQRDYWKWRHNHPD